MSDNTLPGSIETDIGHVQLEHRCPQMIEKDAQPNPPLADYDDLPYPDAIKLVEGNWWLFLEDDLTIDATNITFCPWCGVRLEQATAKSEPETAMWAPGGEGELRRPRGTS